VSFTQAVDLSNWKLIVGSENVYTFTSVILEAGKGLRLYTTTEGNSSGLSWGLPTDTWIESVSYVELRNAEGNIVDTYSINRD
jgi:hypothetical protein